MQERAKNEHKKFLIVGNMVRYPIYNKNDRCVDSGIGIILRDLTQYKNWIQDERNGLFQVMWLKIPCHYRSLGYEPGVKTNVWGKHLDWEL